ncbi:MAG: hypothetical protein ACHQHN_01305 [Sphingobacteriales bacterium]
MEVHHHPEVEHKGFKEYLLEGLMIFLAVMMGFIAENVRESISEHSRAKEYAETMVADLATDTTALRADLTYTGFSVHNVDTLMQLLSSSDIKNIPSGKLYWYGLFGGAQPSFTPNDATFQQMKSSGSLRFFKKSIAREVATYDRLCRRSVSVEEGDHLMFAEVRKLRAQIFEFQYNKQANDIAITMHPEKINRNKVIAFCNSNPPLLTYDKVIFNQYVELVRSRFMDRKVVAADTLLKSASKLIFDLKKEYTIDN